MATAAKQKGKECGWCRDDADDTIEVEHPIVDASADVPICKEHLQEFKDGDPHDCALCGKMADQRFPVRNVEGQFETCSTHFSPVEEALKEVLS